MEITNEIVSGILDFFEALTFSMGEGHNLDGIANCCNSFISNVTLDFDIEITNYSRIASPPLSHTDFTLSFHNVCKTWATISYKLLLNYFEIIAIQELACISKFEFHFLVKFYH